MLIASYFTLFIMFKFGWAAFIFPNIYGSYLITLQFNGRDKKRHIQHKFLAEIPDYYHALILFIQFIIYFVLTLVVNHCKYGKINTQIIANLEILNKLIQVPIRASFRDKQMQIDYKFLVHKG